MGRHLVCVPSKLDHLPVTWEWDPIALVGWQERIDTEIVWKEQVAHSPLCWQVVVKGVLKGGEGLFRCVLTAAVAGVTVSDVQFASTERVKVRLHRPIIQVEVVPEVCVFGQWRHG